jgi:hypothetical protein
MNPLRAANTTPTFRNSSVCCSRDAPEHAILEHVLALETGMGHVDKPRARKFVKALTGIGVRLRRDASHPTDVTAGGTQAPTDDE